MTMFEPQGSIPEEMFNGRPEEMWRELQRRIDADPDGFHLANLLTENMKLRGELALYHSIIKDLWTTMHLAQEWGHSGLPPGKNEERRNG